MVFIYLFYYVFFFLLQMSEPIAHAMRMGCGVPGLTTLSVDPTTS